MEEEAYEFFHTVDYFAVDDLLVDFSNDDDEENNVIANSHGANTTTAVADSSTSSSFSNTGLPNSHGDVQDGTSFSGDLCVPSNEDAIWASRALPMEAFYDDPFTGETFISSLYLSPPSSPTHTAQLWNKEAVEWFHRKNAASPDSGADERRCLNCATGKTVQWRTGPMGPKTLCNACGVRYITGRLVPKYRPVASPTFVLTKHSNYRREVMELRRQKAMAKTHHEVGKDTAMVLEVSSDGDDYLIHHNVGSE